MEATTIHSAEAKRWLSTAVKLLTTRDLHGTRSFAIRARESYPRLDAADEIIAVADTLIAGESRINNQHDWYTVLQVPRKTQSLEVIASQYRRLAILLNPQKHQLPYSDEAFRLICEAWSVLSNPSKKVLYDSEQNVQTQFELGTGSTQLHDRQFLQKHQPQPQPQQPVRRSPRTKEGRPAAPAATETAEEERPSVNNVTDSTRSNRPGRPARQAVPTRAETARSEASSSFWTACPYCYFLYEYPKVYEDCALRCQNCKRAFHAAMIPSPPLTGKSDAYFCCWGFFPLGFSGKGKNTAVSSNWNPISTMFVCPLQGQEKRNTRSSSPKFIYDDEDVYVELSDESDDSDDEWGRSGRRKRVRNSKGKGTVAANIPKRAPSERLKRGNNQNAEGLDNAGNGQVFDGGASGAAPRTDSSKKVVPSASNAKKKGKAKWGRLDLNVEFSNEVEEPAPGMSEGNGAENQEGDNIEGIGFFEGLDEFLSSLPILNVVGDDKVKAT